MTDISYMDWIELKRIDRNSALVSILTTMEDRGSPQIHAMTVAPTTTLTRRLPTMRVITDAHTAMHQLQFAVECSPLFAWVWFTEPV